MSMHHWLVWNVLFPVQEWAKGHATLRILREMEGVDRATPAQVAQLQAARVREFIAYTYAHVPYVRNMMQRAGLEPSHIQGPADLARLSLMRKADVRQHREILRSDQAGKLTRFSTGGSTGAPLIFDLPKERIASAIACRQRVSRWWGLSAGDREFALWGSPVELTRQDRLRTMRDWLFGTELFSAFEMSEAVMSRYLDCLERGRYRMIFAYPSSIYLLCQQARREGRDLRGSGIRAAFVTGEVLFADQRKFITETLNCPVANGYGGRESGFVAHECPHGGMHIMADATVVEVLDSAGRGVPEGTPGEIVVTDLYSREVPFLRYATGDVGVLSSRRCPCGRPLPLLERIEGRTTDFIVAPDGAILHALSVIYVLREIEGIEQFRVRQHALDRFHVQVVKNQRYELGSESRIRAGLEKRLRAPLQVTIDYLPGLEPEASGKFRQVISDVRLDRDGWPPPEAAAHSSGARQSAEMKQGG
jgi:phenylacetate-CoA ligase